jgi:hypothetical protein
MASGAMSLSQLRTSPLTPVRSATNSGLSRMRMSELMSEEALNSAM